MRAVLYIERRSGIDKRNVSPGGTVEGKCPGCGADPFLIKTHEVRRATDNIHWKAGARCVNCKDPVGWVWVKADTIFGLEEDERVLKHGRARVYR